MRKYTCLKNTLKCNERKYEYRKELSKDEYTFLAETYLIFGAEIYDNDLYIFINALVGDTVYSDCMLVLRSFCYIPFKAENTDSICKANCSPFMSFREFLCDGCEADVIEYNEDENTLHIYGNGYINLDGASFYAHMIFSFSRLELFWNAEYDYMTGKKVCGKEKYIPDLSDD